MKIILDAIIETKISNIEMTPIVNSSIIINSAQSIRENFGIKSGTVFYDWGDGVINSTNYSHVYVNPGVYHFKAYTTNAIPYGTYWQLFIEKQYSHNINVRYLWLDLNFFECRTTMNPISFPTQNGTTGSNNQPVRIAFAELYTNSYILNSNISTSKNWIISDCTATNVGGYIHGVAINNYGYLHKCNEKMSATLWPYLSLSSVWNSSIPYIKENTTDIIGPKLNGITWGANSAADLPISYTYTTFPNNLEKILISKAFSGYSSSDEVLTFNQETHSLVLIKQSRTDTTDRRSGWVYLKFIFKDGSSDTDYFYLNTTIYTCLLSNTRIKTIDDEKFIQDINYSDLILTYDFFRGKFTYQFPYYIDQVGNPSKYAEIILENDKIIRISDNHTFYNMVTNTHDTLNINDLENNFNTNNFKFAYLDNGILKSIRIKDIIIKEEKNIFAYNLYTSGTQTYFAENILCSNYYLNLLGPTSSEHKLDLSRMNYVDNNSNYTYDDFNNEYGELASGLYYGELFKYIAGGLNLGLDKGYEEIISKQYYDPKQNIRDAVSNFWRNIKPIDKKNNKDAYWIAFLDKIEIISKELYNINDTITIPDGTWYCVGELKTYHGGDKYQVKLNTTFERI